MEKYMYTQSIDMYLKLYVHTLNSAFTVIMAKRTHNNDVIAVSIENLTKTNHAISQISL